jgi:hypothetical protein
VLRSTGLKVIGLDCSTWHDTISDWPPPLWPETRSTGSLNPVWPEDSVKGLTLGKEDLHRLKREVSLTSER